MWHIRLIKVLLAKASTVGTEQGHMTCFACYMGWLCGKEEGREWGDIVSYTAPSQDDFDEIKHFEK